MRLRLRECFAIGIVGAIGWASVAVQSGRAPVDLPGVSRTAIGAYVTAADYGNAQHPGCGLAWQLVAAIGAVESGHGTFGGAHLESDGTVVPPIRGPQLDGVDFALILDTDNGELDGDPVYDRAVGPVQFIPATWVRYRPGPTADPQNIRDSTKATANLLCTVADNEKRPLTDPAVEEAAIRAYNNSAVYVASVRGFRDDFLAIAPGGGRGTGEVSPEAVASKLGETGRARWEMLDRLIDNAPGTWLDRAYDIADPVAGLLWTTLDRDGAGNAAALTASSAAGKIVKAAEAWVGKDFREGVPAQCAFFVRQVLDDAGVTLTPDVTLQTLDQWSSPGPGVANSFGGDQGLVIERIEDLRPGDVVMFANTYGEWEAGSITHVGIVVEVNGPGADDVIMVDRSTMSAPVRRRPLSTFEHFSGGVRL